MRLHFLVLVFLCFPGILLGQVTKLTNPSEFSEDSLIFPTGRQGTDAREGLFSLGITLHGAPFSKPTVDVVITLPIAPPMLERVIRNEPLTGSSANRPLAIRFRFPVKRVGFELGNGGPETIA